MNKILFRIIFYFILIIKASSGISAVSHVEFYDPWFDYSFDDKTLHKIIKVKVTDEVGEPVLFAEVSFFSSDTVIADFMFSKSYSDSSGIAISVLQCKLSSEIIAHRSPEYYGRNTIIKAIVGDITTEEIPFNIDWGIVDPQFMGPYFMDNMDSFADTTIQNNSTLVIDAKFIPIMGPVDLTKDNFSAYSTNSQIVYVKSAIFEGDEAIIKIIGVSIGISNIIIDGFPAAIMTVEIKNTTNLVNQNLNTPQLITLHQNFPNPFNPETTITYTLQKSTNAVLKIYNLAGQELETLTNGFQPTGEHILTWRPKQLPSGIYFYRLNAGEYSETKKLILQR